MVKREGALLDDVAELDKACKGSQSCTKCCRARGMMTRSREVSRAKAVTSMLAAKHIAATKKRWPRHMIDESSRRGTGTDQRRSRWGNGMECEGVEVR